MSPAASSRPPGISARRVSIFAASPSPRAFSATCARSRPRCRVALPSAIHARRRPDTLKSPSPTTATASAPSPCQRSCRARSWPSKLGSEGVLKSARPVADSVPPSSDADSGDSTSTCSSSATFDGSRVTSSSPCASRPCSVARPPVPSARRSKAYGASSASSPSSAARVSASVFASRRQRGSRSPFSCSRAFNGAGALPDTEMSNSSRSPRATTPMRAGVRPAGAGSVARTIMSMRWRSRGA